MGPCSSAYSLPPDRQNTRFLRFFALFGAQKPNSGVEIFPKKKFFFLRFFDFLTRRWPIQNALVVQKMTGELTLDAQNSPILAFFDFLVPEGYLGCSEQASKTLVKKKNGGTHVLLHTTRFVLCFSPFPLVSPPCVGPTCRLLVACPGQREGR